MTHRRRDPRHAAEQALGVVELVVVMVIVAILGGAVILGFSGAKSSTDAKEVRVVANLYDQAIAQYQADNANRNPSGEIEPGGPMKVLNGASAGPLNLLGKPYIGTVPDGVAAGRVAVDMSTANCTNEFTATSPPPAGAGVPPNAAGLVAYCPETAPAYAIRVYVREKRGTEIWKNCLLGNTSVTAPPRC